MAYPFRKHPWKSLYLLVQALSVFVRIPLWAVLYLPRSVRPRQTWTLKRAIFVRLVRFLTEVEKHTGPIHISPDHRAISRVQNSLALWIPPAQKALIVGKLKKWAEHAEVAPIRIPGYWMHKGGVDIQMGAQPQPGEKVVLSLHGGGYIRLSAHPWDPPAEVGRGLLKHAESVKRVFAPEYRLASAEPFGDANPFPAALLDALAGYLYLVNGVGFSPTDIILEGDSAGGNLAYALTRYLGEYRGIFGLPAPPGALLLLSPWADVSESHQNIPGGSASTLIQSDTLGDPAEVLNYSLRALTGPHGLEAAQINPYFSPASLHPDLVVDFKRFPRTFLVAGGAEVLLDQLRTLRDRMIKEMGEGNGLSEEEGKVRYYEPPDAVHDYLVFPWHEPEVTDTLKAIAEWISLAP